MQNKPKPGDRHIGFSRYFKDKWLAVEIMNSPTIPRDQKRLVRESVVTPYPSLSRTWKDKACWQTTKRQQSGQYEKEKKYVGRRRGDIGPSQIKRINECYQIKQLVKQICSK